MKYLFKKGNPVISNYDDINEEDIFTDEGVPNEELPFDFEEEFIENNDNDDMFKTINVEDFMNIVDLDEEEYDENYDEVNDEDLEKLKKITQNEEDLISIKDTSNNYNRFTQEQKNEIDIELDNVLNTIYDYISAEKVKSTITQSYISYLYDLIGYNRLIEFLKDISSKLEFYNVYLNETIIGFIDGKFSIDDLRR